MSNTQEILKEMARLTMLSNQLNDVQLKNLKSFPFIFFDGIQEVTMEYDLSNQMGTDTIENAKEGEIEYEITGSTRHLHVTYHFNLEPTIKMHHLENRYSALEQSVRGILWKEITLRVYFGKNLMYESPKV